MSSLSVTVPSCSFR